MIRRLLTVAWKEVIQLVRDRRTLPMVLVSPVLQLLLYGYAATTDIRDVRLAYVDRAHTRLGREVIRAVAASGGFRVFEVDSPAAIERAMQSGRATVGLVLPPGFERTLVTARRLELDILADGSEPNTAAIASARLTRILLRVVEDEFAARAPSALPAATVRVQPRVLYNPDLSSRNNTVPGVLVIVLLTITSIMTSMAIVREYEHGTIEQLVVTPVRPWELLAGKLVPYTAIGFVDIALIAAVALAWFGVPIRGSFLLLLALSLPYLLATLGMGILTSTLARTQQQAMMLSFTMLLPNILLSGFMFPIENMPLPAQWFTQIIPARHYMTIVRAIFLKGSGLEMLWPQALALCAIGLAIFLVALRRYATRRV